MNNGWVKLYRDILGHWVYDDPEKLKLWITLLTKATHKKITTNVGYDLVELQPGQLVFGTIKFSKLTGIEKTKLYRIIKLLEKDKMIDYDTETYQGSFSIITIKNWEKYQNEKPISLKSQGSKGDSEKGVKSLRNGDEKETQRQRNGGETEVKTNNNVKNEKNAKNEKKKSQDSSSPDIYEPKYDSESMPFKAACYLRDRILENNPRQPVPEKETEDIEEWATEMDRLNRLGPVGAKDKGYTWKEIGKLIDWCQDHHFWKGNILSAGKFREKIVKLENQMNNESPQNKQAEKDDQLRQLYAEAEG